MARIIRKNKIKKKVLKKEPKKAEKKIKLKKEDSVIRISPEEEKAFEISRHYGFGLLPETTIEKEDITASKKFSESRLKSLHPFQSKENRFSGFLEEKISLIRSIVEKKYENISLPMSACYIGPLKGNPHLKKTDEQTFNLDIFGSSKSISDAMIIETAYVILKDRYPGFELTVHINSIGDKDSTSKFTKELGSFIKKEIHKLPKSCSVDIKKDIYNLFNCTHGVCKEVQDRAPKPMTYLTESSRTHFKELLEYLESTKIPYEINHTLIGSRSYCTDTVFEIRKKKGNEEAVVAIGERYNSIAKKILGKKDLSAVGVAIQLNPHFVIKKKTENIKVKNAKFFFIQIGFEAKLKSLPLLEILRQAKIPVIQSLSKDKLSVQLAQAEKLNVPYIIIMGQKEAIDDTLVVRNMENRSQETISTKDLANYLKKLK